MLEALPPAPWGCADAALALPRIEQVEIGLIARRLQNVLKRNRRGAHGLYGLVDHAVLDAGLTHQGFLNLRPPLVPFSIEGAHHYSARQTIAQRSELIAEPLQNAIALFDPDLDHAEA